MSVFPTGPSVHVCRVNHGDVAIVLDESGSIEADDFVREKDFAVVNTIYIFQFIMCEVVWAWIVHENHCHHFNYQ